MNEENVDNRKEEKPAGEIFFPGKEGAPSFVERHSADPDSEPAAPGPAEPSVGEPPEEESLDITKKVVSIPDDITHAASRPIEVKLKLYEGPLDLLLDIIRKQELDIFDIPMVEVTEQYMAYLNQMKKLNLEIAGEFMVMAATLIYIKSRMLLPQEQEKMEEEGTDPRAELVQKLIEYQAYREAARELDTLQAERSLEFTRKISDYYLKDIAAEAGEIDTFSANLYDLMVAFQQVLKNKAHEAFHSVLQEVISIDDKIAQIKQLFQVKTQIGFRELFTPESTRNELVVTFLAVLEMVKHRVVRLIQSERFGEIHLTRREEEVSEVS